VSDPRRFFAVWQEMTLAGDREVLDGMVAAEHLAPSPELTDYLKQWPGAWYWGDDAHTRLVLVKGTAPARPERWLWHGALLFLFIICTLAAGAVLVGDLVPPVSHSFGQALEGVWQFALFIARDGWRALHRGWTFAVPLLAIFLIHELGHFFAARRYHIDASPPYFLPVPPNISPIGGMGAFLRLRSPVYDRRQLLDVGAAGPLAGFVVAIAVLIWGYHLSHRITTPYNSAQLVMFAGRPILLGDSLLTHYLHEWLLPGAGPIVLAPEAFAGWVGLFITGLNLLPLSQLDGGHVLYGLLGRRQRLVAFGVAAALLFLAPRAPIWFLWVGLTFAIGGGSWAHADVIVQDRAVMRAGRWTGIACIVVFVLTFVPIPFIS
jgi:membrane-associated protease RseP (regulator of RpoE activity)